MGSTMNARLNMLQQSRGAVLPGTQPDSGAYGHQAEAMFSQPMTKIFLDTNEPNAAQWISDTIPGR